MQDEFIFQFIRQYIDLTDHEAELIRAQNLIRFFPKNEVLLTEGAYAKVCYFVIQGAVRAYYLKDGEERNSAFFLENQTITPVSYQTGQVSQYYLACLEDSILAIGSADRNARLVQQIPRLSSLVAQMNQELLLQKTEELDQFKHNTPEERYLKMMREQPSLLHRIPLYHLASYLGITQVSLSRIRKRLAEKQVSD